MYGMLWQMHLTSVIEHPAAAFVLFAKHPCWEMSRQRNPPELGTYGADREV